MGNKAKRKIHDFNFEKEGAHVALVDKAANLQEVLVMKAEEEEITLTLPLRQFLTRFFHMWEEDADLLIQLMGGSVPEEEEVVEEEPQGIATDDFLNTRLDVIGLLKGKEIPEKLPASFIEKIEELEKQLGDKIKTSEDSPLEDNIDIEKGESNVDKTEIEVKELDALKAAANKVEELEGKLEEMDTLKSLVAEMKEEKKAKAKSEMTEVVKGYSFVSEDDQEAVVDFLLKSEDPSVILATLEKARDAISAAVEQEDGAEGAGDGLEDEGLEKATNLTAKILKDRKA